MSWILMLILIFTIQCNAQNECLSVINKELILNDLSYKKNREFVESEIAKAIENNRQSKNANVIYTIPVVVHVIHLGEPIGTGINISDAQILDAISGLNARWRNIAGGSVDMEMQFCLATRDPSGNPTTGINRVNASNLSNYATNGVSFGSNCPGPSEQTIKDLSKWPVASYYNIWVVNTINCHGYNGYAYFPNGSPYDGTLIASFVMTGSSSMLAHEVGHGFNLLHTFEGDGGNVTCPSNNVCSNEGDYVCDTPPHKSYDCVTNSCTTSGNWNNSLLNFMAYCGDHQTLFTQGQKDRARASATIYPRLSLLSSLGCSTLGIDEFNRDSFLIFPNPAKNIITIQLLNFYSKGEVQFFNLVGEKILETKIFNTQTEIDISGLAKGVYFVKFFDGEINLNKKLIIE